MKHVKAELIEQSLTDEEKQAAYKAIADGPSSVSNFLLYSSQTYLFSRLLLVRAWGLAVAVVLCLEAQIPLFLSHPWPLSDLNSVPAAFVKDSITHSIRSATL
jgi:hypothetical protein